MRLYWNKGQHISPYKCYITLQISYIIHIFKRGQKNEWNLIKLFSSVNEE